MLGKKFFQGKVPTEVVEKYRRHIFLGAKDVFGKKFKGYSKSYGEKKRSNTFKGQAARFANTKAPVLTGQLLRAFNKRSAKPKVEQNGFSFGWNIFGNRVEHLRKLGRVLTSEFQPMPEGIIRYMNNEAGKHIFKNMQKKFGANTTTFHKIKK